MKVTALAVFVTLALVAGCNSRSIIGVVDEEEMRWRRAGIEWSCDQTLQGCLLQVSCTSNLPLVLSSLECLLDGQLDYDCGSRVSGTLDFTLDASAVGLDDGQQHSLRLSVRGRYGSGHVTLPWYIDFQVTDCISSLPTTEATTMTTATTPRPTTTATTMTTTTTTTTQPPSVAPPQQQSSEVTCTAEQVGSELVVTCVCSDSNVNIVRISYFINGIPKGSIFGDKVNISESEFQEGENTISLTVYKDDGSSSNVDIKVMVEREQSPPSGTPSTVSCRYECSATLSSTELEIMCNVNGSHVSISHIDFTVNDDSEDRAGSIPTFSIPASRFDDGANVVLITVSHSDCGPATLRLDFDFPPHPQPPTTPAPTTPPQYDVTCGIGQDGRDVVLTCASHTSTITRISYSIDGVLLGSDVGNVVRLLDGQLQVGENSLSLTVFKADGTSEELEIVLNLESPVTPTPTGPPGSLECVYKCNGTLRPAELAMEVTCGVNIAGQLSSIEYQVNGGASHNASSIPTFSILAGLFQGGVNSVSITVNHHLCSGPGVIDFNFPYHGPTTPQQPTVPSQPPTQPPSQPPTQPPSQPPSPACNVEVNCTYELVNGELQFRCQSPDVADVIILITYSLNGQAEQESTGGTFSIPQSSLVDGENCLDLSFSVLCSGTINIIQVIKKLNFQLEIQSQFSVAVLSTLPENYETLVPSFPLLATFEVEGDYLVITVTSSSQGVLVVGHALNGAAFSYIAGDTVRIHKDDLLQGENEIQLTVFGNLGGRLTLTSTLMVGAQPTTVPPLSVVCDSQSGEEGVGVHCSANRPVSSLAFQCHIDGTLLLNCGLDMFLGYNTSHMTPGQHTLSLRATDDNGLVVTIQISFNVKDFEICCKGVCDCEERVIHMTCDTNRAAADTRYQVNHGALIQHSLPRFDIAVDDTVSGAIVVDVLAEDQYGNTNTTQLNFSC